MQTTITVLAWIGLVVTALCIGATLFIWAVWCWGNVLEAGTRMLGMLHATHYYVGLVCRRRDARFKEAAGLLLFARYQHMREHEPEIAAGFDKHYRRHQELMKLDSPNPNSGPAAERA